MGGPGGSPPAAKSFSPEAQPCIFSIQNRQGDAQGGARMTSAPGAEAAVAGRGQPDPGAVRGGRPRAVLPRLVRAAAHPHRVHVGPRIKLRQVLTGVRKMPGWPRSWANFGPLSLYSRRNARANLEFLGQPNSFLARGRRGAATAATRTARGARGPSPCTRTATGCGRARRRPPPPARAGPSRPPGAARPSASRTPAPWASVQRWEKRTEGSSLVFPLSVYCQAETCRVHETANARCAGRRAGVITLTQPEVPEATIRGSPEGFQRVILGPERVLGVLKGVQRGPTGPPGPLELAALAQGRGELRRGRHHRGGRHRALVRRGPGGTPQHVEPIRDIRLLIRHVCAS
jgi:hypothetical protein